MIHFIKKIDDNNEHCLLKRYFWHVNAEIQLKISSTTQILSYSTLVRSVCCCVILRVCMWPHMICLYSVRKCAGSLVICMPSQRQHRSPCALISNLRTAEQTVDSKRSSDRFVVQSISGWWMISQIYVCLCALDSLFYCKNY